MRAGSGEISLFCFLERTSQAVFLPLSWEDRVTLFLLHFHHTRIDHAKLRDFRSFKRRSLENSSDKQCAG